MRALRGTRVLEEAGERVSIKESREKSSVGRACIVHFRRIRHSPLYGAF